MAATPNQSKKRSAKPRRSAAASFIVFGLLGAAFLMGATLLVFAMGGSSTPGDDATAAASSADAGPRARRQAAAPFVSQTLTDAQGKSLLSGQTEQKRNQILVVDLFHEILGRYPNFREQRLWFDVGSPANQALQQLRHQNRPEVELANYVAGMLMAGPEHQGRVALIIDPAGKRKSPALPDPTDGAAVVGAMLARAVGYGADIPRAQDAQLVRKLADAFRLSGPSERNLEAMKKMMKEVSGSSDVGEHFLEDSSELNVEADGMKVALRRGRLIAVNGSDVLGKSRYIAVVGFDGKGDFLVRDPTGRLPEKISPVVLMAFLQKSGIDRAQGQGFWIDMPGTRRTGPCPPSGRPSAPPSVAEAPPVFDPDATFTSVIPGAQLNLARARIPEGEHTMRGTLSLGASQIDELLAAANSPAAGTGAAWVKWGTYYNLDPAYALAFFRRESNYGAHPRWIGRMGSGKFTKNVGNIRYRGPPNPQRQPQYGVHNGFRAYASWDDGIQDWFKLLSQDSNYAGLHTVEQVLPVYAPTFENDTDAYIRDVVNWVKEWRGRFSRPTVRPAVASEVTASEVRLARANENCP